MTSSHQWLVSGAKALLNPSQSLFLPRRPFLIGFGGHSWCLCQFGKSQSVWIHPHSCKWAGLEDGKGERNPGVSPVRPQVWTFWKPHPVPRSLWKPWQPYLQRGSRGWGEWGEGDLKSARERQREEKSRAERDGEYPM